MNATTTTSLDGRQSGPDTLAAIRKDIGRRATTSGSAPYGFNVMGADGLSFRVWARCEITTGPRPGSASHIHHGDLLEVQVLLEDSGTPTGEILVATFPVGGGTSTRVVADCIVAIIRQTESR